MSPSVAILLMATASLLHHANKKICACSHTYALLTPVGVESMGYTRFNLSLPHMAFKWGLIVLNVCVS